jgi:hypothetical protein
MYRLIYYLTIFQLFIAKVDAIGQLAPCTEKIYLQTDRDVYIAGEELFFTCYRFDTNVPKDWTGSKFAYLVLRNEKNSLINGICLKLENNRFSGSLYLPDTLSSGWYQLVSYTNYMRNAGEKSFFSREILIVNRFDKDFSGLYPNLPATDTTLYRGASVLPDNGTKSLVSLTPEKKVYSKREKIRVSIDALGLKTDEIAHISISVREKIPKTIDNRLENSVLKQNPTGFPETNATCQYLPEINGIILGGHVLNDDNQPISSTSVFLSTPDTISNLQFTKTNNTGAFRFLLSDYYNEKKLILTLPDLTKGRIELDDKYDLKEPYQPSGLFADTVLKDYLIRSQEIVQIQKTYKMEMAEELREKTSVDPTIPMAYPPLQDPVYPSDFVSLPDFVEISREILPLLKTRKHGGKYDARMLNQTNFQFFNKDPLIFLDGVPINNIEQIIGLGTKNIHKIETLGAERYDGGRFYAGILAVFSIGNEINNIVWKTPMLGTTYEQFHPSSVFVAPVYSKASKMPDFRQLLYWEPSITLKANEKKYVEFQASDNMGEFEITAEGVTNNGKLIKTKAFVKVAFRSK